MLRLGVGFYRAVLRILGPEDDHFRAGCFKHRDDFFVPVWPDDREKAAVANYNSNVMVLCAVISCMLLFAANPLTCALDGNE